MTVLTPRHLNRATLARQLLLRRTRRCARDIVAHLVGLQAQDPDPPYIGLWSRIDGFQLDDLATLLHRRELVRAPLLRGTQHLVTADDYRWLRPLLQPLLTRVQKRAFGRDTAGVDLTELAATARKLLDRRTITRPELGKELAQHWPGRDAVALARSAQMLLPVVHPPPDGLWGRRGPTPFALAEQWLGASLAAEPSARDLVVRYLAAFGPATVHDIQAWSGMTRLREVVASLRPQLRGFRTRAGQPLFDLPDAPRPDPDEPAPVRFLAALDNVLLGHADRSRVMTDDRRPYVIVDAALTVDGFVHGLWRLTQRDDKAVLVVRLFSPIPRSHRDAVSEEATRLLQFVAPQATSYDVEFHPITET